jgi:hypothetical protein
VIVSANVNLTRDFRYGQELAVTLSLAREIFSLLILHVRQLEFFVIKDSAK